VLPLFITI